MDHKHPSPSPQTVPHRLDVSPSPLAQPVLPSHSGSPQAVPWELILQIGTKRDTVIRVGLTDHLVIGRADPIVGYRPDLDLTPFGAHEAGVSRRHAAIDAVQGGLYVADLGSTNGTWLNGRALIPQQPYRLQAGDKVRLSGLRIAVCVACPSASYDAPTALHQ